MSLLKLWVTAGGTGSAWHISSIVKEYFGDKIELYISDVNEPELVASATLADHFFKVPYSNAPGYAEYMYNLLKENSIDFIIPLIPWEQEFFSPDNMEFKKLGIGSAAPMIELSEKLNSKTGLYDFCKEHNIPTIENVEYNSIAPDEEYFIKPVNGFGAVGAHKIKGSEISEEDYDSNVIQEYCEGPEITVEAFSYNGSLHTIARQRIEAKSGVCTKAKILNIPEVNNIIKTFTECYAFPKVFNIQFVNKNGVWKVMDVNLRLAAGTGLSNAAGFQLVRAYLETLLGNEPDDSLFNVDYKIVSVLRVYKEVVVK